MNTVTVMVVEDDFRVAEINRQVTEQVEGFRVSRVAKTGEEALAWLEKDPIDLVVLDVYLPGMQGVDLLREVRHRGYAVDFILITAAHDSLTIEASMRFGVFDYLIKPFDFERFKESLAEFRRRKTTLTSGAALDQGRLDHLLKKTRTDRGNDPLPKGISPQTLARIQTQIEAHMKTIVAADLVEKLSLSRVTAQRYLEYLSEAGRLRKELIYKKVGRPSVVYFKIESF